METAYYYRATRNPSMKQTALAALAVSLAFLLLTIGAAGQELASLTGVVTDSTGAVIPDARVQLVDTKTNASYEAKTNSVGAYTFVKLLPGPGYQLTVTREGFEVLTISDIYIAVGATHTTNAQLQVGKVSEKVDVSAAGAAVSLNTTDSVIGNNIDMHGVHELPIEARESPLALLDQQPGVVDTNVANDPNSSREGAVTGARGDQNNVTLDGLDVNDFATGQAFVTVGDAPVDSIQEFRVETANPLAASGRGSGAQIELVTKSGTNQWHGSAFEYLRNTVTEANTFFNNRDNISKPKLNRNSFGANLGGPVKKDKLFFFFNYQGRRDAREDSVVTVVPLDSFRNGNVSYINSGAGCTNLSRVNTQPSCISTLSTAQIRAQGLDPGQDPSTGLPGPDSTLLSFINSRYPHANDLTAGDGVNTGGFRFNAPVGRTINDYVARVDYNLTNKMKLFGRFSILRDTAGDDQNFLAPIEFPGDPLTRQIVDTSYAYVIGHTWTVSNSMVNQLFYGETRSQLNFPVLFNPAGTNSFTFGPVTAPFASAQVQRRTVPVPVLRDDFTYVRGKHNIQVGGTFKPIRTRSTQISDFNFATIGLGGNLTSLAAGNQPSDILQDPAALNLWDQDFSFALGRFASVDTNINYDRSLQPLPLGTGHRRDYRYYETEIYLQDSWRMRTDLTMTYGLRWQYYSVPYETSGLEAIPNQGFNQFFSPRLQDGPQGIPGPFPFVTYDLGGKANHEPGLYHPDWRDFAPRLSFAYNPGATSGFMGRLLGDRKTVIRAGAGVVFDHPVANALNFIQDQASYLFFQTVNNPTPGDLATDPRFTDIQTVPSNTPPVVTRPAIPFVSSGVPFGAAVGASNYAIDPNFKTPYSLSYTFGIQRELPGNFLFEANYFARLGRRLLAQADAGQVVNFKDPASGHFLAGDFADLSKQLRTGLDPNTTAVNPEPFFENQIFPGATQIVAQALQTLVVRGDLADTVQQLDAFGVLTPGVGLNPQFPTNAYITNKSFSSYNGLLATLHKRLSNNLQFDFNYTYAHSIDNISAPANNVFGSSNFAGGLICDVTNLRVCRGSSDFDITHNIGATGIYQLPLGRGHRFGGSVPGWTNQLIGGWQIATIVNWHTGFAFQTVSNAFPLSFFNNVPAIFNGDKAAVATHIHTDPASGAVQLFANPARALSAYSGPLGLQAGPRNNLRGPGYSNLNLGVAKHFPIRENMQLEFRADAYNAFNHVNFNLPGVVGNVGTADITDPTQFGVITTAAPSRQMQFALRLDF
jgi:Carboxypeptidase regulatory-like domain